MNQTDEYYEAEEDDEFEPDDGRAGILRPCPSGPAMTTDTLRTLREQRDRARATFEEAIVAAHAEGRPITKIAAECGWSRQAVYDLLKRRSQV